MQKIGSSTNTADANGEFTDGDPQTQVPCTWVMAAWLNTLQRELVHLCEEAGITIDPNDDTQVYQAIAQLLNTSTEGMVKTVNEHEPDEHGNVKLGSAADADITTSSFDTVLGHLLKVGDYGFGIGNGSSKLLTSIYDITCTGIYNVMGKGTQSPTEGVPADSGNTRYSAFALNIYAGQYWVALFSSTEFYIGQVKTTDNTSSWSRYYNTSFKQTAEDTGALPLTGGTMTGLTTFTINGECISLKNDSATMAAYVSWHDNDGTRLGYFGRGGANKDMIWSNQTAGSAIYLPENGAVQINTKSNSSPIVLNGITQSLYYKATGRPGAGSFASQFTQFAPFYHEFSSVSTSEYEPLWKQKHIDGNTMWSGGMLVNAENFVFQYINSAGTTTNITLHPSGQILPGSYANFDARYGQKNTASLAAGGGWWQDASTGLIMQMGIVNRTGYSTSVTFPKAFPNFCIGVHLTLNMYVDNLDGSRDNIRALSHSNTGFVYGSNGDPEKTAFWVAFGK